MKLSACVLLIAAQVLAVYCDVQSFKIPLVGVQDNNKPQDRLNKYQWDPKHQTYGPISQASREEINIFVQDILDSLTLAGKIGQMTQLDVTMIINPNTATLNYTMLQQAVEYGVGSYLNSPYSSNIDNEKSGFSPSDWISFVNNVQSYVIKNTPENITSTPIPMIYGIDSVHGGNYIYGSVMFPHNLGIGATFNPDLAGKAAAVTAKDSRASGLPWVFAPVLGIGVQPLWPRIYETFGEDPYVGSMMADSFVRSMQGNGSLANSQYAACTIKHFLGYSDPKSGKDRTPAWIPDRMLYRYFVPPFQSGIEAGAVSAMINSGEISGIPVHASKQYLTELLRQDLGFEGVAVTDWQDIEKLQYYHHIAPDYTEATRLAIEAGIDMSMVPSDYSFPQNLMELVTSGAISESRLDESVRRILNLKVALGLFDHPYASESNPLLNTIGSDSDRELAHDIAAEGITLLKNEGVLPLNVGKSGNVKRILVCGPAGNSLVNQHGGWSIHWQGAVSDNEFAFGTTIFKGMLNNVDATVHVTYYQGANFTDLTDINQVLGEAQISDAIIVAVGEPPEAEIPGDINDLALSPSQVTLIGSIRGVTSSPIITVLVEARPRILGDVVESASNAILMAFLPGSEGGQAVADIITGAVNPSGKLPMTYPQYSGDIGVQYYKKYSDVTTPLYSFGYGLSYTTFTYSNLMLSSDTIQIGQSVTVYVTVTNSGKMAGKETVLLYVGDEYASVTPEVMMLRKFTKQSFQPGESKEFSFVLTNEDFSFIGVDNQPTIEAGTFIITVGDLQTTLQLTGTTKKFSSLSAV